VQANPSNRVRRRRGRSERAPKSAREVILHFPEI
jgi:hypothetical protein